jgi:hypothetical protein
VYHPFARAAPNPSRTCLERKGQPIFWSNRNPPSKSDRVRLACEELETRANPVTIWNVNTHDDLADFDLSDLEPADPNGKVSLRAAIMQANVNYDLQGGKYRINIMFPPPATVDGEQVPPQMHTIQLLGPLPEFTGDIDVVGGGSHHVTIAGGGQAGIFHIGVDSDSSINHLTIRGGVNNATAPLGNGQGGAIRNLGRLSVNGVFMTDCSASTLGGAISNSRLLTLSQSKISNCKTTGPGDYGGGISAQDPVSVTTISKATIENCNTTAAGRGGGHLDTKQLARGDVLDEPRRQSVERGGRRVLLRRSVRRGRRRVERKRGVSSRRGHIRFWWDCQPRGGECLDE